MEHLVAALAAVCMLGATWGAERPASQPPLALRPLQTLIVLPEGTQDAELKSAAQTLRQWLLKACRVEKGFEISGEGRAGAEGAARPLLALGPTKWADPKETAKLARDGFLIRRTGHVIVIAGGSGRGTYFGAIAFLDRFCGVRFYMPGDLFTSLPRNKDLTVREVDVTDAPYVRSCFMSGLGTVPGDSEWAMRNGVAVSRRLGGTHQHSMFDVFPPAKYAVKYPEIYPTFKGQRYVPQSGSDQQWQPCFSEPKLLDAAEETSLEYFRKNPAHGYLAFSVMDGHRFCECARCAEEVKKLGATAAHSKLYWEFMNGLALRYEQKLPGKCVLGMAYSEAREAPPFPLRPNIVVFLNIHVADLLVNGYLVKGPGGAAPLDPWLKAAKLLGNHEWAEGMMFFIPRLYPRLEQQFLRYCRDHGADVVFQHAEEYPHWGLDGPKPYLTARLWWNPDTDVDALWKQFCEDLFGPAAQPMYEYFTALERLWIALDGKSKRKLRKWDNQFLTDAEDRKAIEQCRAMLDRAREKAATEDEEKRIDLFSKSFRLSEHLFALAAAPKADPAKVEEVKRYALETLLLDPMTFYRRGNGEAFLDYLNQALGAVSRK